MNDIDYYRLLSMIGFSINYVWISLPTTLNYIICMVYRPENPKSAICTAERSDDHARRFNSYRAFGAYDFDSLYFSLFLPVPGRMLTGKCPVTYFPPRKEF